jgi:cGMP-dependent protein kinase
MIARFTDPVAAAKYVVAEAYRLWLTFDERTDDITIVVIYFENIVAETPKASNLSTTNAPGSPLHSRNSFRIAPDSPPEVTNQIQVGTALEVKPVRNVSKNKRKEISEAILSEEKDQFDFSSVVNLKSEEEIARISSMLRNNFMFENLTALQKEQIFSVMTLKNVKAQETVIAEGDEGNEMYIVDR